MNRGCFKVTLPLIEGILNLPEGNRATAIFQTPSDQLKQQFSVVVVGPDMPEYFDGMELMIVPPFQERT